MCLLCYEFGVLRQEVLAYGLSPIRASLPNTYTRSALCQLGKLVHVELCKARKEHLVYFREGLKNVLLIGEALAVGYWLWQFGLRRTQPRQLVRAIEP